MPTLDATVGGAAANSYVTLVDAEAYFASRRDDAAWESASEDEKVEALIMATARLEEEDFAGLPVYPPTGTSPSQTQALKWPRWGAKTPDGYQYLSTVIPQPLKDACCELALVLLNTDLFADTGLEGFEELNLGPLKLKPRHIQEAGELPEVIKRKLGHLLQTPPGGQVRLHRG